jgi:hypothetical protein
MEVKVEVNKSLSSILNLFKNNNVHVGKFTEHAIDTYVGKDFYNALNRATVDFVIINNNGVCLILKEDDDIPKLSELIEDHGEVSFFYEMTTEQINTIKRHL